MLERKLQMQSDQTGIRTESSQAEIQEWKSKIHLSNINEDPFLSRKINHIINVGNNKVGKTGSIKIGGLGVNKEHCSIKYDPDEPNGLVLSPNKDDHQKFKVLVDGELVDSDKPLQHGNHVLFGNSNLFVVVFPGQEVSEDMQDYESVMQVMLKDQLEAYGGATAP